MNENSGERTVNAVDENIREFLTTRGFLNKKKSLGENESLTESGVIDSIGLLQLADHLERTYKIEIPLELITPDSFDTLAGISQTVMDLKNK